MIDSASIGRFCSKEDTSANSKRRDIFQEVDQDEKSLINRSHYEEIREFQASKPLVENEMYRELYKNFSLTVTEELARELDTVAHNEKIGDKEYKYGLPVKNETQFKDLIVRDEETEELPKTENEKLWELLDLNDESSYESLVLKVQDQFNNGT